VTLPVSKCGPDVVFVPDSVAGESTAVVAVLELLPGTVSELDVAVAVVEIVLPAGALPLTCVASVNVDVAPAANDVVVVQLVVAQLQPGGGVIDVNVSAAGSGTVSDALAASLGPLFVTAIV
jgi:hypothetical protein